MLLRDRTGIRIASGLMKWYLGSYAGLLAILAALLLARGMSVSRLVETFPRLTLYFVKEPVAWGLAFVPYLVFSWFALSCAAAAMG